MRTWDGHGNPYEKHGRKVCINSTTELNEIFYACLNLYFQELKSTMMEKESMNHSIKILIPYYLRWIRELLLALKIEESNKQGTPYQGSH
jgi:hypothetical protein